jgi:hypothetical protein
MKPYYLELQCDLSMRQRKLRQLIRIARTVGAPSAGQDGPPLYPGPLCGGELGTTGRAAGIDRDVDAFSSGQESGRKARPQLMYFPGMEARQAPSGVAFLFGYLSLWPHKEKVTRAPKAHENSCL